MSERSWIQAIHEMLRDGLASADSELREDDPGSTCAPVKIRRAGKSVVISFNAKVAFSIRGEPVCIKDRLFPLFREQEGVARMCDYWILCEQGDEAPTLYVLLFELKSTKPGGVAQIENGKLLAEYFLRMVAHHRQLGTGRIEYRGVVFSRAFRSYKAGLRPGPIPYKKLGKLSLPVAYLSDGSEVHLSALCG